MGAAVSVEPSHTKLDVSAASSFVIVQDEGNTGTTTYNVIVRRGGDTTGAHTVTATVSGTGVTPADAADFVGGVFPTEVLSFGAGETSKAFAVGVQGDTTAEFDETFKVTLSAPSGGAALVASGKSEITCTITNDDAALTSNFVWLGSTLTAAPTITGAPASATYLNGTETAFVTRAG